MLEPPRRPVQPDNLTVNASAARNCPPNCGSLFREGAGACTARCLNATKLEDLIIERVRERILTEETITEQVTLVAEEIDNLAGEVNGSLTAISAELTDVDGRLENLYQALETKHLPIEALSPRILSLKARQDQLAAAREEAEGQLVAAAGGVAHQPGDQGVRGRLPGVPLVLQLRVNL